MEEQQECGWRCWPTAGAPRRLRTEQTSLMQAREEDEAAEVQPAEQHQEEHRTRTRTRGVCGAWCLPSSSYEASVDAQQQRPTRAARASRSEVTKNEKEKSSPVETIHDSQSGLAS